MRESLMAVDREVEAILTDQLEQLDRIFSRARIPLAKRPDEALAILLEHCIDVKTADGEKVTGSIFEHAWGRGLFADVYLWFRGRYGAALQPNDDYRMGFVLIAGAPFRVRIPLVIRKPSDKPREGWVYIPNELWGEEDPQSWIVARPNLRALGARVVADTGKHLKEVVGLVRSIHVDVFTASRADDRFGPLIQTVESHMGKAARDLCASSEGDRSAGMWELHLAIEKAFKAFVAQRGRPFKKIHLLPRLYKDAVAAGMSPMPARLVEALPRAEESIRYRYGQKNPPTIHESWRAYRHALRTVRHCTKYLQRRIRMNNTGFRLRALWNDEQ